MISSLFGKFVTNLTTFAIKKLWLGKIEGIANVPPYPCIIIANHASYLDFLLLGYSLRISVGVPFSFWAKKKVVDHPLWGVYSSISNVIEVSDKEFHGKLVESTRNAIENGDYVCIFPEGTRSRSGELLSFKRGYLKIASKLGVEIVPAFLENTHQTWPTHKIFPRLKKCNVTFFPPIQIPEDADNSEIQKLNMTIREKYVLQCSDNSIKQSE